MCGRITLRMPARAVAEFLRRNVSSIPEPRFNIGPGQESLVARLSENGSDEREVCSMNWNFVPSWNREEKPASIINARSETVGERPSFRSAFRNRRALLLADGFYEWK